MKGTKRVSFIHHQSIISKECLATEARLKEQLPPSLEWIDGTVPRGMAFNEITSKPGRHCSVSIDST